MLQKKPTNGVEEAANQTKELGDLAAGSEPYSDRSSRSCVRSLWLGWKVYMRQSVVMAGISLALLYMTVLGFDGVTTGLTETTRPRGDNFCFHIHRVYLLEWAF